MVLDEHLEIKRGRIFQAVYGADYRDNTSDVSKADFYTRIYNIVKTDRSLIQSEEEITGPFAVRLKPLLDSDAELDELTAADLRAIFKV